MNTDTGRLVSNKALQHVMETLPRAERRRLGKKFIQITPTPEQAKRMKVGRNDPCPCGSGKKFKHCHWTGLKP